MSKHSSGDAKLNIGKEVRVRNQPKQWRPAIKDNQAPQVPDKGTNSLNQYR
jgi:hypothetical protein